MSRLREHLRRVEGPRARLVVGLAAVAALAVVGAATGALGEDTTAPQASSRPEAQDVVLGGLDEPAGVPDARTDERGAPRPEPVKRPAAADDEVDGPPQRILEENKRIRRDLEHLRKLEAERRRVSGALALAAADFDGPLRLGAGGLAWPVNGAVVSPFGQRWGRLHAGIDIASPAGTVIRAAQSGRVVISAPTGGYGNYVCVQHTTRLSSCYAHLSRFLVGRGAAVRQGSPIGLVGCTGHCFGDHLHFETWVDQQPVDPMGYL